MIYDVIIVRAGFKDSQGGKTLYSSFLPISLVF